MAKQQPGNELEDEDVEMELLDDLGRGGQTRAKKRKPLFDRGAYYPSTVPFAPVDVPHDPNAITHDTGIPPDLAEQVPPPALQAGTSDSSIPDLSGFFVTRFQPAPPRPFSKTYNTHHYLYCFSLFSSPGLASCTTCSGVRV